MASVTLSYNKTRMYLLWSVVRYDMKQDQEGRRGPNRVTIHWRLGSAFVEPFVATTARATLVGRHGFDSKYYSCSFALEMANLYKCRRFLKYLRRVSS